MSNWAEDMLINLERDIKNLELLEKKESDENKKKQFTSMKNGLQKQLLDLYRYAIKEGTPFDKERLKHYESFHQTKKLYLSDPHLEERNLSPIMRTKSAEEEMFHQIEEQAKEKKEKKGRTTIDLSFLSKRQQETIQLYADGLTYSDIGELIGVKKGTVSKHLQLARSKAKEHCNFAVQLEMCMEEVDDIEMSQEPKKREKKKGSSSALQQEKQVEMKLKVSHKKVKK